MSEPTKQYQDDAKKQEDSGDGNYVLRLFVSGMLQNSICAIKNLKQICDQYLKDNYVLEVIDIYQQPDLAVTEQIIVIPVLIIKFPLPERRLLGDLSDIEKVVEVLNIKSQYDA